MCKMRGHGDNRRHVDGKAGGGGISFLSSEGSYLKRIFGGGSRKINAHACLHCSHLELTVEFTDKDHKRYQDFNGPQPGVLDRIN